MGTFSQERMGRSIQQALAESIEGISREFNPKGLTTLTNVVMSSGNQFARIYISSFGGKYSVESVVAHLESQNGRIRSMIGRHIRMKSLPEIRFCVDDTLDRLERIQEIIEENPISPLDDSEVTTSSEPDNDSVSPSTLNDSH